MKINFDFYTLNTASIGTVLEITESLNLETLNVSRHQWSDPQCWNISGTIDHSDMQQLFDHFEQNDYVDDADLLS